MKRDTNINMKTSIAIKSRKKRKKRKRNLKKKKNVTCFLKKPEGKRVYGQRWCWRMMKTSEYDPRRPTTGQADTKVAYGACARAWMIALHLPSTPQ